MTINKALMALALAFVLAAMTNQPPAQAQDAMAAMNTVNQTNQMMLHATGVYDTPAPAKPKPQPRQQVIVVPPGARVVYARPKPQKYTYNTVKIGNVTRIRFVDHELGVVCYFDNNHNPHYGGQKDGCVYSPSIKRP